MIRVRIKQKHHHDPRPPTANRLSLTACRTPTVTKSCAAPAWWPERCAQDPIPSRTRPSNAPAPMVLCLKTRESRSPPGLPSTRHATHSLTQAQRFGAGWSSPVARQAHNLKVAGSNPAPATNTPSQHTARAITRADPTPQPAGPKRSAGFLLSAIPTPRHNPADPEEGRGDIQNPAPPHDR